MDGNRLAFIDDSYKNAAHDENWRDKIVELTDFGPVCSIDAAEYDKWPNGLDALWPYPKQLGETRIRKQFGRRDVIYLVGEDDHFHKSNVECPERVQGPDTLSKTLLYYNHLERHYGAELQHRMRVVADVGHKGCEEMTSPEGIEEIFRARPIKEQEELVIDYSDLTTVYGRINRLQVEQVGPRAQLRCNLKTEGNISHTAFFAYLDGDDAIIVSRQLDLMREAFVNDLRVRLLYNADGGGNWKRFYDLRVYRDD